ncbi:hypothetical protein [Metabacillus litoralis]|uniref:hypothetical protein n=1 Tax=Metabacillus litoralis TaxID=152268 RepID=UPI001CFE3019|nr:hypothetical protein [Metabacillus litoralis]
MRFVSMTLLVFFGSLLLIFLFLNLFNGDETGAMSIGLVLLLMMSIIITLLIKLIETIKKK